MRGTLNVSPNFTYKEFACKCCGEVKVSLELIDKLEQLREFLGGRPIIVTSGFRCAKHNKEIGGAPNSLHLKGEAADILVRNMSGPELALAAGKIFKAVGIAKNWIHVDTRKHYARWYYGEGRKHEKVLVSD